MTDLEIHLHAIHTNLAQASQHLAKLRQVLADLEQAGMYPGLPAEQWQSRNGGEKDYLYMVFRLAEDGKSYEGPEGKRKVYVGNKAEAIVEARRLAANRQYWSELNTLARSLERWLILRQRETQNLAGETNRWPRVKEL